MNDNERSYYCSMKFKFLKIDLESNTTYNCHAASPHAIDFTYLDKNPGQLFNIPINVAERQQMLNNQRNRSCEQNCWTAEDRGATSPRIVQFGTEKTHTDVFAPPEEIDLTLGSDCNLTCSYCCKEFSNGWRRDLIKDGDYTITDAPDDRYTITPRDRMLVNIKQSTLKQSKRYQQLLEEITFCAPNLKKLVVTGGEPLLDNHLLGILENLPVSNTTEIRIYTGLGVSNTRFNKILDQLAGIPNLILFISAENTHKYLEFNRYGNKWDEYLDKIQQIKKRNIRHIFQSTLSNLTLFGFTEFYKMFGDNTTRVLFAYQPRFMAPNVLDQQSKQYLAEQFQSLPVDLRDRLIKSMQEPAGEKDRTNMCEFLKQFVQRRGDLDINIYPKSFLEWLGV